MNTPQDHSPNNDGITPSPFVSYPGPERRNTPIDRRNRLRSGKYDRRKHKCGGCAHFTSPDTCGLGVLVPTSDDTFACLEFQGL